MADPNYKVAWKHPYHIADGIADCPGYPLNEYLYRVHSDKRIVSIETCYSSLTGEVAELFYGISPDEDNEDWIRKTPRTTPWRSF